MSRKAREGSTPFIPTILLHGVMEAYLFYMQGARVRFPLERQISSKYKNFGGVVELVDTIIGS